MIILALLLFFLLASAVAAVLIIYTVCSKLAMRVMCAIVLTLRHSEIHIEVVIATQIHSASALCLWII